MTPESQGAVALAYVHSTEVAHSWHKAVVELIGYDLAHESRILRGGWFAHSCHSGKIPEARNGVIADFLADPGGAEWLFWVDTDMGFAGDALEQLMAVADPVERPVVGGLCFARKELVPDGLNGFHCVVYPTIFDWSSEKQCPMGWPTYPPNALVRCFGTGSAFILIHRSVLEQVAAQFGPNWYTEIPGPDGGKISEDLAFCVRVNALDIPVHVHTGVRTSHLKNFWLQDHDFWQRQIPPPADERVTVIVPVLGRPQNAEPFMRSLRASTGMADVFVGLNYMGDEDSAKAWADAGAESVWQVEGVSSFAEKVNEGYRHLLDLDPLAKWIFITGDDVRFYPGWLDHVLHTAKLTGAKVVGTNDLGNPRVMAGDHATHLLISTAYIREQGASWDGPGVACHEGYRHWFVDDEIVTVAKQRGVWAFAPASIVEHLHPLWHKGEMDATYELGQSSAQEDSATFAARVARYAGEAA